MDLLKEEQQKILDLFYSNEHANDLLVFEILKQRKNDQFSILLLNSLILASKRLVFKEEIYKYIRANFSKKYHLGIRLLNVKRYGHFAIKPLLSMLEPAFSKIEKLELFYRYTKRTGKGHDVFLIVDNREHPKRKEIFQDFLKNENGGSLNIPGLFPDEIEECATNFFEKLSKPDRLQISLNSLKSPEIPEIVFSKKYDALIYRNDFFNEKISSFPNFIFQFKNLRKITLNLHPKINVPENWSQLGALKILAFSKDGPVFQNLNFLETIPNLKYASNMTLGKPELFLQQKHIEISSSDIPEKIRNKQRIILPSEIISQVGNDLKKSELSEERQHYFFEKLLIQKLSKFSEEEIEELSTVDFERKVKRYFYRVMKQRFGPRLTER